VTSISAQSRWPTHAESILVDAAVGGDLKHPLDARRCTVQLSSGRLYLDAVASNATSLLGHDTPDAAAGGASSARQLLSSLEQGYACATTAGSFSAAANMASKLSRLAAEKHGRIVEANSLDGEPASECDFLVAYENETLGRSGRWCSSAAWRRTPELIVIGEAIALGAPFGAVLAREDVKADLTAVGRETVQDEGADSASLALVAAVIATVEGSDLLPHGRQLADYLFERLLAVRATCPEIQSVECNGLSFRVTFAPPLTAAQVRRRMCERGVLAGVVASGRLALDPPLPLRIAEADVITGALRSALLDLPLVGASVCCPACEREG
jgi:4-aminobutyrate aminotransferase-like enzyme